MHTHAQHSVPPPEGKKSASNKLNCTGYCNCEKVVNINTDAHPPELMNEDPDLELVLLVCLMLE